MTASLRIVTFHVKRLGAHAPAAARSGDLNAMSPRALAGSHDARPRWALDWILTSDVLAHRALRVVTTELSDHAMLIAELVMADAARAA